MEGPGSLTWAPVRADLVAPPVATALASWTEGTRVLGAEIDPDLADTAAFCRRYSVDPADSANCVVIAGRRGEETTYAACVLLATTRADVNGLVRRTLAARKASFAPMDDAISLTEMEYGGITPIGLPPAWTILIDAAVLAREMVVIGSGLRRSKLALPASALSQLGQATVVEGLAG